MENINQRVVRVPVPGVANVVEAVEPVAAGLPKFNVSQQRFLAQRQVGRAWSWSALRPTL